MNFSNPSISTETNSSSSKYSILMLHNRYLIGGGEDVSTLNEVGLLRSGGHNVDLVQYDNLDIEKVGKVGTALRTVWSRPAVRDVIERLGRKHYDILHVQNYFPLISPAVLRTASHRGVATVQALRNYRLLCANAQLFRDGHDCEICVGRFVPWWGVAYGCYRGSRMGSAAIAAMIGTHKALGTWAKHTDAFIAVSDHVRGKYIAGGFPEERVFAKPNVVAAPAESSVERKNQISYVGRLSSEKGVEVLIKAWEIAGRSGKLVIAGDGPADTSLRRQAAGDSSIVFLGRIPSSEALRVMAESKAIVIPSRWAEPFPRTGVEALSVGTPVFGAASGGIVELIAAGRGGALYEADDVEELARLIRRLLNDDFYASKLAGEAREVFEMRYAPGATLLRTEEIYKAALLRCRSLKR